MRTALGLFHFNHQYIAGDSLSYHRYVSQAIIPSLELIAEDPRYRISFEIAGCGLEFLAENYPGAISLLRSLIDSGNVELISSTYAPTIWVAFPARDLRKSIEMNRQTLDSLGLRSSAIFFAQEAFFGLGLSQIADLFPVALCKDDYMGYYRQNLIIASAYRLGTLRIVVGRGHIRSALCELQKGAELKLSRDTDHPSPFWYHMGSGHHLVSPAHPHSWPQFFAEEDWIDSTRTFFRKISEENMRMGTITEYVNSLELVDLEAWPFTPEGSWNARRSEGIYAWMGRHTHSWEADAELLSLVWRGRRVVRQLDRLLEVYPATRNIFEEELSRIWRLLILAESSDPLGWEPLRGEVRSGIVAAEEVLRLASSLLSRWSASYFRDPRDKHAANAPMNVYSPNTITEGIAELVGGNGSIRWRHASHEEYICDIDIVATESTCGVRFLRSSDTCFYSPSGLESDVYLLDPAHFDCDAIYLPLANGYIGLSDELHLIRLNIFGQTAAQICTSSKWISFITSVNQRGKRFHWRFLLLHSTWGVAVARANEANDV